MPPVSQEVRARASKERGRAPVGTETEKALARAKRGAEIGRSPGTAKASVATLARDQNHPTRSKVTKATRRTSVGNTSKESAGQAAHAPGSTIHLVDSFKEDSAQKVRTACSLITNRRPQQPSRTMKKRVGHQAKKVSPKAEGARGTNGAAKADEASLQRLLSVSSAPGIWEPLRLTSRRGGTDRPQGREAGIVSPRA